MIVVTGATGNLGRLVVERLLARVPASQVVAAVRQPERAADLAARGVTVRAADYTVPASLDAAFAGAEKVLLISSNVVGARVAQHAAVIDAAKRAGVKLLAYTSILHADTATHALAREHQETEALLRASGLPFVSLRNGWYLENYTEQLEGALARGGFAGSAGSGKIAAAARADYAEAAAVALTQPGHETKVYELAGDTAFTMEALAREVSRQAGKTLGYTDLPVAEYEHVLARAGLPAPLAHALASADGAIARGELFDDAATLHRLIGRATTSLSSAVARALGSLAPGRAVAQNEPAGVA
ncbi:MAG: SDR family oxidoreductase [Polyangiales bacterium]